MSVAGARAPAREVARIGRRLDLPTVRAAWWAGTSLRSLRKALRDVGLEASVPPPPQLPEHAIAGVNGLLTRVAGASCLERSLILQRWLAGQGRAYPVLIGVALDNGFEAHAWLEGYDTDSARFSVLTRVDAG